MHDRTGQRTPIEQELALDEFPGPEDLWQRYCCWKGIASTEKRATVETPYYDDGSGKAPRYYQVIAINRTIEAIAKGGKRILLVMATGTGKTYTAFQIIWRLWKSKARKRILFLADRNILVDQTRTNDFKPFGPAMTKITNRRPTRPSRSTSRSIRRSPAMKKRKHLQAVLAGLLRPGGHRRMPPRQRRRRFRLARNPRLLLRCHTPRPHRHPQGDPREVSNSHYFGEPVYTYSLRQGIDDGFLAPYKVVRIDLDKDSKAGAPKRVRPTSTAS
jgi:type I restriction enzyme R subunit